MLNKVILIGRFTRDPELRSTPQGTSTCSFSLAVDRNYQSAGGERQTDFINCVAWRQTAEFISKYFQKGNLICVEGSIQTRSWKDNDGNNRYATDVVVDRTYFVESKKSAQSSSYSSGMDAAPVFNDSPFGNLPDPISPLGTDDDLPF
ncbi:MAG: single-stranded DNA-binding protein [Clostridia bacterium]|nr:single-stranded DNA-binding protein [Clostridia bacterium]